MKFFRFAVFVAVAIQFLSIRAAPLPEDSKSNSPSVASGTNGQLKQNSGGILGGILGQGNKNDKNLLSGGSLLNGQIPNAGKSFFQKLNKQYHRDVNAAYDFVIGRFNDRKEIWHSENGATGTNSNNGNQQQQTTN